MSTGQPREDKSLRSRGPRIWALGAIATLVLSLLGTLALRGLRQPQQQADSVSLYARALEHCRLAEQAGRRDDLNTARSEYETAADLLSELLRREPGNARAQRELAASSMKEGELALKMGGLAAARDAYERSVRMNEQLRAADPRDAQVQSDLSVGLLKLGDVSSQLGGPTQSEECEVKRELCQRGRPALLAYQRSVQLTESLAAIGPGSAQARRDLSIRLARLGGALARMRQYSEAQGAYQRSLRIAAELALAAPGDAQAQRELSSVLSALGSVAVSMHQYAKAEAAYERSVQLLAEQTLSGSARSQRDLVNGLLNLLGVVVMREARPAEVRAASQRALMRLKRLPGVATGSDQERYELADTLLRLGELPAQLGPLVEDRSPVHRALQLFETLVDTDVLDLRIGLGSGIMEFMELLPQGANGQRRTLSPTELGRAQIRLGLAQRLRRAAVQAQDRSWLDEAEAFLGLALRCERELLALDDRNASVLRQSLADYLDLAELRHQRKKSPASELLQAELLFGKLRPQLPDAEARALKERLRAAQRPSSGSAQKKREASASCVPDRLILARPAPSAQNEGRVP